MRDDGRAEGRSSGSPRSLAGPRPSLLAAAAGLVVSACAAEPPPEPVEVEADPRATYLRTHDDASVGAEPIALDALEVSPGDEIRLEALGAWNNGRGELYRGAAAVFSRSADLLPADSLRRVPGAVPVHVAPEYRSWDSYRGGVPTDIPEDFLVAGEGVGDDGVVVTVPAGAGYLFVTARDHLFGDNVPGDAGWGVRITRVGSAGG